jgi:copper chaperone NosL
MRQPLAKFYAFLDQPLRGWTRIVLALLVIPLVLAFTEPLWRIRLEAPQYPKGLYMDIYAHKLESGNNGQHLAEINNLNHYIGMKRIDRAELSDLDWLPFAIGFLGLIALRCAAIGNVRALVDLAVLTGYVSLFGLFRFAYKLYVFGHNLAPDAAFKVEPFTPALLGTKTIANFTTHSLPQWGSAMIGAFATGVVALLLYHLVAGRLEAARAERAVPA